MIVNKSKIYNFANHKVSKNYDKLLNKPLWEITFKFTKLNHAFELLNHTKKNYPKTSSLTGTNIFIYESQQLKQSKRLSATIVLCFDNPNEAKKFHFKQGINIPTPQNWFDEYKENAVLFFGGSADHLIKDIQDAVYGIMELRK